MNQSTEATAHERTDLRSFSHPRYFYGQRLDVRHFEGEQEYFQRKIWMLNRLVHGYGVVCGLDVQPSDDRRGVVVMPGIALDKLGREIVVPGRSDAVAVPPAETQTGDKPDGRQEQHYRDSECGDFVQLLICFHTCDADPEPVLAGGCDTPNPCAAGATRERYRIVVREGKAPPIRFDCAADLLIGNRINYPALARWISQPCGCPTDPCIPLANIRRPREGAHIESTDVDIAIRPVVFNLDVLFQLMWMITGEGHPRRAGK